MTSRRRPGAAGLAPPELARKIRPGAVFAVRDGAIGLPSDRDESAGERTMHATRRCVVVQALVWGNSKRPRTLLVIPCSASQRGPAPPWDIAVPPGTAGFDAPSVVAYVSLVQPVLKSDLAHYHGDVDQGFLQALRARLAEVLDLAEVEALGDEDEEEAGPPRP